VALGVGADPDTVNHPPDLTVNVLGLQYAWLFTYPDLGVTTGELHVPVGKDLRLLLKAQDVIHAFWLPEFRLKQDTLPNQQAELRFVPKRIGEYPIVCAELCGPYHGGMASKLYVHSQEDYDQWVQSQIAAKTPDSEKTVAMVGDRSDSDAAYLARHADHLANHLGIDTTTLSPLPTSNAVNHDSN
jgi:cytochrome c oxidase subunit 2